MNWLRQTFTSFGRILDEKVFKWRSQWLSSNALAIEDEHWSPLLRNWHDFLEGEDYLALKQLSEEMSGMSARKLQSHGHALRHNQHTFPSEFWWTLGTRDLHDLHSLPLPALGLIAQHPDGKVREKALALLAASGDAAALPHIILRLRDWVPAIRRRASKALRHRLLLHGAEQLMPYLDYVDYARQSKWGEVKEFLDVFFNRVMDFPSPISLINALSQNKLQSRLAAELLLNFPLTTQLVEAFCACADAVSQGKLIKYWQTNPSLAKWELLQLMLNSRQPFIRLNLLQLIQSGEHIENKQKLAVAKNLLLDPCYSVRKTAAWYVQHIQSEFDLNSFYLQQWQNTAAPQSFFGLCDQAKITDLALLKERWPLAPAKQRMAISSAFVKLDFPNHKAFLFNEFIRSEGKLCRHLADSFIEARELPQKTDLMKWMDKVHPPQRTHQTLRFCEAMSFWHGLALTLPLLAHCHPQNIKAISQMTESLLSRYTAGGRLSSSAERLMLKAAVDEVSQSGRDLPEEKLLPWLSKEM